MAYVIMLTDRNGTQLSARCIIHQALSFLDRKKDEPMDGRVSIARIVVGWSEGRAVPNNQV